MTKQNTLRKAAILVSSLDVRSADALLDEMAPEQATRVRNAVMELGEVDPQEQQQVMRDFVRHAPQPSRHADPAVELDLSFSPRLPSQASSIPATSAHGPHETGAIPFGFLDHVEAEELAQVLMREHPQTAAIVISHLPPSRAADVLRRLPSSLQSVALIRIARLESLSRDVVRDIEHEMQAFLQHRQQIEPVAAQGVATIRAILEATSAPERQTLLGELARQDQTLARHFGEAATMTNTQSPSQTTAPATESTVHPPAGHRFDLWSSTEHAPPLEEPGNVAGPRLLNFSDLEKLEDAALAQVLHESSPHTALLALAGASHDFVERILQQLPARDAGLLQRKMQQLGPIRLDDVEHAQKRLADVAQRLVEEGEIAMPPLERFAVAA
ncbi:MAG: FliG C-terminal domain-containing protein [Pirellulaceae bacterium]